MALELPPELAAVLDLLGLHWPQVNEDELDELADGLRGVASRIDSVQMVADKALTALGEVYHGTSADRLAELWKTVSTYSGLVVEACGVAANALNAAALVIEGCKSATVVQLVSTQGELAVSSLLGPEDSAAVIAVGRQILSTVLEDAVSALGQALAQPVADLAETVVRQLVPGDGSGSAGTVGAGFGVDLGQLASCAAELRRHADDIDSHGSSFRRVVEGLDVGDPGDAFGRLVIAAVEQIATTVGVEVLKRLLGSFRGTADRMDRVAQNLTENEDSTTRQIHAVLSEQKSPTSPRPLRLAGGAGGPVTGGAFHTGPSATGGANVGPHHADTAGLLVGAAPGPVRVPGLHAPDKPLADGLTGETSRAGVPPRQPRAVEGGPHPVDPHRGTARVSPRSEAGSGAGHGGVGLGPLDRGPAVRTAGMPGTASYGQAGGGSYQSGPGSSRVAGQVRDAAARPDAALGPGRDEPAEDPVERLAAPRSSGAATAQDVWEAAG